MQKAIVMCRVKPNTEIDVYNRIVNLRGVLDIYQVFGEWDIVAIVEVDDIKNLDELVTKKIRINENIKNTVTMIVAKGD